MSIAFQVAYKTTQVHEKLNCTTSNHKPLFLSYDINALCIQHNIVEVN